MLDFTILTGVTVALTQILKGFIPSKFIALSSVGIAVVLGGVYGYMNGAEVVSSLWAGLIAGLTASGFYDAATHPFTK